MRLTDPLRTSLTKTAIQLADRAREVTLRYFRQPDLGADHKPGTKGDFDPVTEADRAAEAAMRALLADLRPDDGIIGEEHGNHQGRSGLTWVLDPIDGTRGYISGTPTWGTLIAVQDAQGPVLGVIDQPYIGERFFGCDEAAWSDGPMGQTALACRARGGIADAIMLSTFPEIGTAEEYGAFRRVADQVRLVRYGMDCYGYALLAAGQVDLVIEAGLEPYDIAAPIAVIEAAGGCVSDWDGRPAHNGGRVVAAANEDLHAAALELLHRA